MLAFVFFVAILNLGIGYVLGGGEIPAILTQIPFLNRKPKPAEIDLEDSLTKPAMVDPSDTTVDSGTNPQLQIPDDLAETFDKPETAEVEEETPVEEVSSEPEAESLQKKAPSSKELLAGLSTLQLKLAEASDQLKEQQDSPEEFEACANELQAANHDYLQNAHGAVAQLSKLSEDGNEDAGKIGNVVAKGAEEAQQISDKIDTLLDSPLDEDGRRNLVEHSSKMASTVTKSHQEADELIHSAIEDSPTTNSAEKSAEELITLVESAVDSISDNNSLFLAEAKLDPIMPAVPSKKIMDTISGDLREMISNVLDESQSYTCEGRRLMFLNGDSLDQAINRVELLRQSYEKTVYKDEAESVTGTLTCTISEIKKGTDSSEINTILEKSALEADSLGTNQTLHHDGAFATPVEPVAHDFSPRIVELS